MALYWKICAVLTLAFSVQVFAQQRRKLGGWNEVKEDDKGVQNALKFAQEEFNRISNDESIIKINRIFKLTRQIVAGTIYRMEFEAAMSSCKNSDIEQCSDETPHTKTCNFEVLMVPWQNVREIRTSSCR